MEYITLVLLGLVGILMVLIYLKISKTNENTKLAEEIGIERQVKDGFSQIEKGFVQLNTKQGDVLKELSVRLEKIDAAQKDLNNLKTEIIDFKNLFNNQTSRGRIGNESLQKLVSDVLNKKHYKFEYQLSNGKRADCFLLIGAKSENIAIDAKFSWENYTKQANEKDENKKKIFAKEFSNDIKRHIADISDKYIIPNETAKFAVMYVPSEGVFHAIATPASNFAEKAKEKNVIIVSPNSLFGVLQTYNILFQKKEMSEKADIIQGEFAKIYEDISRFAERYYDIEKKFSQQGENFRELNISVEKIKNRADRVKKLEFNKQTLIEK